MENREWGGNKDFKKPWLSIQAYIGYREGVIEKADFIANNNIKYDTSSRNERHFY